MKLEVENTELESQIRILQNSVDSTKEKLDTTIEKAVIIKSEYDELIEKYRADIERLRQETKDLQEEIEVQARKSGLKGYTNINLSRRSSISSATIDTTNEGVSSKGLGVQSFTTIECASPKTNCLPSKVVSTSEPYLNLSRGMDEEDKEKDIESNPRTLILIDKLLDDIDSSLNQIPLIN